MPSSRAADHSQPRRDPFSCQTCRVKKLKCDRQQPCSNCKTRRLACEYARNSSLTALPAGLAGRRANVTAENEDLKARIRRLEQAVFGSHASKALPTPQYGKDSLSTSEAKRGSTSAAIDSEWLEGIGTRLNDVIPRSSSTFKVTTHTADHFESGSEQLLKPILVSIPTLEATMADIDSWERYIDAMMPVIHVPSLRETTRNVYSRLEIDQDADSGAIALILAISATVCLWKFHVGLHDDHSHGSSQAAITLAEQAQKALERGRYMSEISLQAVQAMILLSFHIGHLDGFSSHTRMLQSSAFTMARSLGLHRIDAPNSSHSISTQSELIDLEMGRRVWWHLACTDWMFSYIGGPHEGTYSIQPRHMSVNRPRNLTNNDLSTRDMAFKRPDDEPTAMLFYFQRMKLAVVCREIVDAILSSSVIPEPEQIPYDLVMELDSRFGALIGGLPKALRLDMLNEHLRLKAGDSYDECMVFQSVLANVFIHSRRCRLHLPFLIRLPSNPQFAFSRQMCLESAHKILETRRMFCLAESSGAFAASLRLGGNMSHMFLAIIVLVMDICVNNPDDQERLTELHDVVKIVEEMRTSSQAASKFLESLTGILQKHQVRLPSTDIQHRTHSGQEQVTAHENANPNENHESQILGGDAVFEDIWQDLLYKGPLIDPPEWDALLQDLGMQIG